MFTKRDALLILVGIGIAISGGVLAIAFGGAGHGPFGIPLSANLGALAEIFMVFVIPALIPQEPAVLDFQLPLFVWPLYGLVLQRSKPAIFLTVAAVITASQAIPAAAIMQSSRAGDSADVAFNLTIPWLGFVLCLLIIATSQKWSIKLASCGLVAITLSTITNVSCAGYNSLIEFGEKRIRAGIESGIADAIQAENATRIFSLVRENISSIHDPRLACLAFRHKKITVVALTLLRYKLAFLDKCKDYGINVQEEILTHPYASMIVALYVDFNFNVQDETLLARLWKLSPKDRESHKLLISRLVARPEYEFGMKDDLLRRSLLQDETVQKWISETTPVLDYEDRIVHAYWGSEEFRLALINGFSQVSTDDTGGEIFTLPPH